MANFHLLTDSIISFLPQISDAKQKNSFSQKKIVFLLFHSIMEKSKPISKKKLVIKVLIAVVLSMLFTVFSAQFIPSIMIGKIQFEYVIALLFYLVLLIFLSLKYEKIFALTSGILTAIIFVMMVFNIGWDETSIYKSSFLIFGKSQSSYQKTDIKAAEHAITPHISLQKRIQQSVNSKDSTVRLFAVEHSLLYFNEYYGKYRQICRQFSLVKYIKDNFKYVKDPANFDYFASPTESIQVMAGDCDDYSILMASAMGAIGVKMRIIWTEGHVYPEMCCGDKTSFDKYVNAIYLFFTDEVEGKPINYRLDKDGNYWLNLDLTDYYPGSKYYSDVVLSIIYMK